MCHWRRRGRAEGCSGSSWGLEEIETEVQVSTREGGAMSSAVENWIGSVEGERERERGDSQVKGGGSGERGTKSVASSDGGIRRGTEICHSAMT